jgi:SAM-dependent methyltransferase
MTPSLLDLLICPDCPGEVGLSLSGERHEHGEIAAGNLTCPACRQAWPIRGGIPRFVAETEDYSGNFAYEWQRWGRVQIDRFANHRLSMTRFLADSRWPGDWLKGKLILDAGCGAGRFADVAATLGARVVAVDLSDAATVAQANTRDHDGRVNVIQASLFRLPLRTGRFDGVFCMGVIQHTPEPERVIARLPSYLKAGGRLAYNFYEIDWRTRLQPIKYALRALTRHLSNRVNERLSWALVVTFFPLSWLLSHVRFVRIINVMLPICAAHNRELTVAQQFQWTLLDTFDWYSPRYEIRQSHTRVASLLRTLGLEQVDSRPGLAWAVKPLPGG